jgi:hypothetical protein
MGDSWQDAKARGSAAYAAKRFEDAVSEFSTALTTVGVQISLSNLRRRSLSMRLRDGTKEFSCAGVSLASFEA